jgi:hypothetical protein
MKNKYSLLQRDLQRKKAHNGKELVKYRQDGDIIPNMVRIIAREIGILIFSVSIFPITFMLLLLKGDISRYGFTLIYREIINLGSHSLDSTLSFFARLLAPYIAIQAFRAYQWSKKGKTPRKWAHLYFALLTGCAGVWFACKSLDLFYFMFELGDIPGELAQFFRLEYVHLLWALAGFYLSLRFFQSALRPKYFLPKKD